ncbi:MAG: response regulator [Bacteroidota bacterium]
MGLARRLHIAIVEDDRHMTEMLSDFISSKYPSAQIEVFKSGEEALSDLSTRPDLVILDYHLDSMNPTAMNGLQILEKLKERYKDIQVVFLSAQESTEIAANTVKYGAFDYILKNQQAFHRLEVVFRNLLGNADLRKNLGTQRFFNYFLALIVILLMVGIVMRRINGM